MRRKEKWRIWLLSEIIKSYSSSRWPCRKTVTPQIYWNYSFVRNNFLQGGTKTTNKKKLKTGGAIHSHQVKERKSTLKWVGKAEIQSCYKPHPWQQPIVGRELKTWSFSWEMKGLYPTSGTPNFKILRLALEKCVPKHLALKSNGSHTQETDGAVVSWEMPLKGLACRLPAPELSAETTLGKDFMWQRILC